MFMIEMVLTKREHNDDDDYDDDAALGLRRRVGVQDSRCSGGRERVIIFCL